MLKKKNKNSSQRLEVGMQGIGNLLMTLNKHRFHRSYTYNCLRCKWHIHTQNQH